MKLKKIIITLAIMSCLAVFAGCEPNVGTDEAGTTSIMTTPAVPRADETTAVTTEIEDTAVGENTPAAFKYPGYFNVSPSKIYQSSDKVFFATGGTPAFNFMKLSNNPGKIGWGLGKETDSKNRPTDALAAQKKYEELGAIFIDDKTENRIYITFDEGYENGYTPQILDALKAAGVKATFFVTYDYCKDQPELIRRMINEGHEVGNHSYSHPSFADVSPDTVREEIQKLHDYVRENFGYEMRLVRFPKGEFSEQSLAVAKELGYSSVFWSFAYSDWQVDSQPSPDEAYQKITAATHPGAVILLHAVSETNAKILPDLLEFWIGSGLKPDLIR